MFFQTLTTNHSASGGDNGSPAKKETNHNLRLILLAIRLQRPVKSLPAHLISPERISRKSLANEYHAEGSSNNEASAYKMAGRHLDYMDKIFKLESDGCGYVMSHRFDTFYDMFKFWLNTMGEPKESDKRLHVMLQGVLRAIDSGFRSDPICVSNLALQLKQKYGQKNIRDTKEPLEELFSEETLAAYLGIYEDDSNTYRIGKEYDPLLLRWRSRGDVGDNHDISINLAVPGRIRAMFRDHTHHLEPALKEKVDVIAKAVFQSLIWENDAGEQMVPYILYREGEQGPLMLTLYSPQQKEYVDLPFESIQSIPDTECERFIPYDMPPSLWDQFRQLAV